MKSKLSENFGAIVLFQNKKYSIEKTVDCKICVITDGIYSDFGTIYFDKSFSFTDDYPKYIVKEIKRAVKSNF